MLKERDMKVVKNNKMVFDALFDLYLKAERFNLEIYIINPLKRKQIIVGFRGLIGCVNVSKNMYVSRETYYMFLDSFRNAFDVVEYYTEK